MRSPALLHLLCTAHFCFALNLLGGRPELGRRHPKCNQQPAQHPQGCSGLAGAGGAGAAHGWLLPGLASPGQDTPGPMAGQPNPSIQVMASPAPAQPWPALRLPPDAAAAAAAHAVHGPRVRFRARRLRLPIAMQASFTHSGGKAGMLGHGAFAAAQPGRENPPLPVSCARRNAYDSTRNRFRATPKRSGTVSGPFCQWLSVLGGGLQGRSLPPL